MNGQATMAMNPVPGGPVGGPQMKVQQQVGGQGTMADMQNRLNTYIYDHFLQTKQFDLARQFLKANLVRLKTTKPNGVTLDVNPKDGPKPNDLSDPDLPPHHGENSFLLDWFAMFWDTFHAAKQGNVVRPMAAEYLRQQRIRNDMTGAQDPKLLGMNLQQRMAANGMAANGMKIGMNNRGQPMTQEMQMQQRKMMNQNMQRDPTNIDMAGQRPSTPGGPMDNAPSPSKKPRLDNGNGFEGPALGAGGRPMGNSMLQNGMPDGQMSFGPNGQSKLEGINGMQPSMEGINYLRDPQMNQANATGDGRHALQDYQMQLMLLEQQNKKRLLQARREQDHISNHMQGPGPAQAGTGNSQMFAPNMSPSGSRGAGPSPNPNDQMKRGTPKIPQAGLPGSPMPEMQQRASPGAPSFDPSNGPMHQGMPPQYFAQIGGMRQPPSSHPQFAINPQQMEQMQRMAQANGGRLPNGQPWPAGAQNPGMQAGLANQQNLAGMAAAAQARGTMAPPPAPAEAPQAAQQRAQESSPAQQPAPPTPNQSNKAGPRKKEPAKKKNAPKKQNSTTAATPTESAEPTTSAPATPMTPVQTFNKPGSQMSANQTQPPPPAQVSQPTLDLNPTNTSLFGLGDVEPDFTLDFAQTASNTNPVDVLDGFDFESFLQTDDQSFAMQFDLDPGVETGAGPV